MLKNVSTTSKILESAFGYCDIKIIKGRARIHIYKMKPINQKGEHIFINQKIKKND